jgi:hypothetical protein
MKAKRLNFLPPGQLGCLLSLNILMSISHNTLNLLETRGMELQSMLSELNEVFPPVNPTPADDLTTIMYRAGQRSVVEYILTTMEN